jgi:hypothetical protein
MDLEARVLGTNLRVHGEETLSSLEEFGQVLPKFRNEDSRVNANIKCLFLPQGDYKYSPSHTSSL